MPGGRGVTVGKFCTSWLTPGLTGSLTTGNWDVGVDLCGAWALTGHL
jgi:hypothetical protein